MERTDRPETFRPWRIPALCVVMLVVALLADRTIAGWTTPHYRYVKHHSFVAMAVKELGAYKVMAGVVVLLCILHARHWWAGALVLAAAGIGGLFEITFKWIVGRQRPLRGELFHIEPFTFEFFRGGVSGFFKQSNLCFPSGHATCAFAMAATLSYLLPRWTLLWFACAVLVGVERVAELAHYPSDVVGGAIFGVLSFHLARRLFDLFDPARSMIRPQQIAAVEQASS